LRPHLVKLQKQLDHFNQTHIWYKNWSLRKY